MAGRRPNKIGRGQYSGSTKWELCEQ